MSEPKRKKKLRLISIIYLRDGRKCWWCAVPLLEVCDVPLTEGCLPDDYPTLDHLVRRRDGGSWEPENLVVSCPPCNYGREKQAA